MKRNVVLPLLLIAATLIYTGCEKGAGDFSVLSETSQFQQASVFVPRKIDVLFVIDNSGSMQTSQTNLANNFPSFINYFKSKGYDFRIAVTTTDAFYGDQFVTAGCTLCNLAQAQFRGNPKVVDNNTPDLENVFKVNAQVGINGAGDERAFSSLKAALSSPLNVNFHRRDAFLSVIIVSDEEDFSHVGSNWNESYTNPGLFAVSIYKDFLQTFTAGQATSDFSVSTISVIDEACRATLGGVAKVATRYMELAAITGGTKNSLCNSFATVLDNISASIAAQTQAEFQLNKKPLVESIRVLIDGAVVPQNNTSGWSYDSVTLKLKINGSAYQPSAGSSITINFDPDLT